MRPILACAAACVFAAVPARAAIEFGDPASLLVSFTSTTVQPLAARLAATAGDAVLDVIVSSSGYPAYFTCYTGNGDGTFGGIQSSGSLQSDAVDMVVGDFNNDAIIDFAVVNRAACGG